MKLIVTLIHDLNRIAKSALIKGDFASALKAKEMQLKYTLDMQTDTITNPVKMSEADLEKMICNLTEQVQQM